MKSKYFASICTGTSNAFRRRAGMCSVVRPQVAMCARPRIRRPLASTHGLIGPQAWQTINHNLVALSAYTRAGVNRTVGAIDLQANGFFSEIPPEVVDEAGNPLAVTEETQPLPCRSNYSCSSKTNLHDLITLIAINAQKTFTMRTHDGIEAEFEAVVVVVR